MKGKGEIKESELTQIKDDKDSILVSVKSDPTLVSYVEKGLKSPKRDENTSLRKRIECLEKSLFELRERISPLEREIKKVREYIGMSR